ncbi:SHOCT domain-containing protein [Ureibacillus massiliensis]|nr:SHOCT domain-containing protein [Ureibacillus massiliensis]
MHLHTADYLLSVHILKEMLEENLITEEEYREIDRLNQQSFNKKELAN